MPTVVHISDIHIGVSTRCRHVITLLHDKIKQINPEFVFIAGDIFENKDNLTPTELDLFEILVKGIACPILIIPGNHDCVPGDRPIDLIKSVSRSYPHVKYLPPGETIQSGVKLWHWSILGHNSLPADPSKYVLVAHGQWRKLQEKIDVTKFASAMLGDVHSYDPRGYCGSLMQLRVGDSHEKGFITWYFEPNSVQHRFVDLKVAPNFLTVELQNVGLVDVPKHITPGSYQKIVLMLSESQNSDEYARAVRECVEPGAEISVCVDTPSVEAKDIDEILVKFATKVGCDPEMLTVKHSSDVKHRWWPTSISWSNFGPYGEHNNINFMDGSKFIGISAPNRSGKTTIIDALVLTLFDEYLRGDRASSIRAGTKAATIQVTFICDEREYVVTRVEAKSAKCTMTRNGEEVVFKDVATFYSHMRSLVGTVEQFLATSLYYENQMDITRMSNADRVKIFPALLGLPDYDGIVRASKIKTNVFTREEYDKAKVEMQRLSDRIDFLCTQVGLHDAKTVEVRIAEIKTLLEDPSRAEYKILKSQYDVLAAKFPGINKQFVLNASARLTTSREKLELELKECETTVDTQTRPYVDLWINTNCPDCNHNAKLVASQADNERAIEDRLYAEKRMEEIRLQLRYYDDYDDIVRMSRLKMTMKNMPQDTDDLCMELAKLEIAPTTNLAEVRAEHSAAVIAMTKLKKSIAEYESVDPNMAAYVRVISDSKFRVAIVSTYMDKLCSRANAFLKSMTSEQSWIITHVSDEKKITLYIAFKHGETQMRLPVSAGSGYQRLVTSLAVRFALTTMISNACPCMFVDECFGNLDGDNLTSTMEALRIHSENFKYIFVTSFKPIPHADMLQLNVENGVSSIGVIIPEPEQPLLAEAPVIVPKDSIACACGSVVKNSSIKAHVKTIKHKNGVRR